MFSAEKGGGSMPGAKHIDFKDLFKPEDGTIKEDKDLKDCKNKCIVKRNTDCTFYKAKT